MDRVAFVFPITLADVGQLSRNPVIITGEWFKGGKKISVTLEAIRTMLANFAKVKNAEVNVDYEHASEMGAFVSRGGPLPSAGKLASLEEPQRYIPPGGDDGVERWIVYGSYEFTPTAREMIQKREYRYVSPAFGDMPDRETGESQGFTLSTVALTNRPLMWEMPEVWAASVTEAMSPDAVHVPGVMGKDSPATAGKENAMSTKCCFKASAEGKHEVWNGDGDGAQKVGEMDESHIKKYAKNQLGMSDGGGDTATATATVLAEIGCAGVTLADVKALVEKGKAQPGVAVPQKTDVELICACIDSDKGQLKMASVDALLDDQKIKPSSFRKAVDADKKVSAAFTAGKLKPANRAKALELCLANETAFDEFIGNASPVIDTRRHSVDRPSETGEKTAGIQLASLIDEVAADRKISKDAALNVVIHTERGKALWEAKRLEELAEGARK